MPPTGNEMTGNHFYIQLALLRGSGIRRVRPIASRLSKVTENKNTSIWQHEKKTYYNSYISTQ
jgi:hypothetical protein